MDRREALKKLAAGGAVAAGATAVMTSTAYADGGTSGCRPTGLPAPAVTLTPAITGLGKNAVQITSSISSVGLATCSSCKAGVTPTQVVQYRWTVDGNSLVSIFGVSTGGTAISGGFQSSLTNPVFLRNTSGTGNLGSATYTVRLTARWVCTNGPKKAWACRHWTVTFTFDTGGGGDGTLSGVGATTAGSGNSSACDSPTP